MVTIEINVLFYFSNDPFGRIGNAPFIVNPLPNVLRFEGIFINMKMPSIIKRNIRPGMRIE
jgi:hypothetical protein